MSVRHEAASEHGRTKIGPAVPCERDHLSPCRFMPSRSIGVSKNRGTLDSGFLCMQSRGVW